MTGSPSHRGGVLHIAAFTLTYFAITSVTVALTRFSGGIALVWLGTAIGAAMLITTPRNRWLPALAAIVAASAAATSLFGLGPGIALPLALVNGLEGWLVALLLVFARPRQDWLDSVAGLTWMILIAGLVAPALAAMPGAIAVSTVVPGPWQHHAALWLAAHGLGTLLGLPIALMIARARPAALRHRWSGLRLLELTGLLALVFAVSIASIAQSGLPLLFLPLAPLLLAAFRGEREGAALGTLVIAGVAVWALGRGTSPISALPLSFAQKALFFQFYLATISLLAIPVSVSLRQHRLLVAELEERKALKRLIADHSDDALLNLDPHGLIRYASPAGERLSGEDALVGKPLALFFDPLDELLVRAVLAQAAAAPGETFALERPVLRGEDQLWLHGKLRAVPCLDRPGVIQGFAVTLRDVSARKQTELDAIHAAETDALTGLPNRRALLARLERTLAHADQRPFALAIIDLDHFKAINDGYGHPAGDAVLREVALVMGRLSGPSRFFARLGGEEFALVCTDPEPAAAEKLCEQLRREIAAIGLFDALGEPYRVTASLGMVRLARRATAAQALQIADRLLYRAKNAGRDRVEVSPGSPFERANRRAA